MAYRSGEAIGAEREALTAFFDRALPPGCAWAARSDFACDPPLTPAERAYVAGCHPKRAAEFRAGRDCALSALAAVGAPVGPLGRGDDRLPQWPSGYLGSITHCPGLCLALAAEAGPITRLACDAEPDVPLPDGIVSRILLPQEHAAQGRSGLPDALWFSAKETVFKAVFPAVRAYFGFEEATVEVDPTGTFAATLSVSIANRAGIARLAGLWGLTAGYIVTLIAA